uniref:Uncharacterized protein n=1 Tax=Marseillevirus LCMAC103 TaxID=2506604 RepID=A0A481YU43_9VIRU|nr:MAG: hypothetical protein LCMAC103_00110 [Marseillevirus LCMAC103]
MADLRISQDLAIHNLDGFESIKLPNKSLAFESVRQQGSAFYNLTDTCIYYADGLTWRKVFSVGSVGEVCIKDIDLDTSICVDDGKDNDTIVLLTPAAGGYTSTIGTGGVAIDTTGAFSIDSSSVTAASNLSTVGAAGFDLTVASSAGSLNLTGGESAADAVVITATIGGIDILAPGAAAGEDIDIVATGSSVNITSTESATDAIVLDATLGGIDILASGASAGEDIDIVATGSSVNVASTEAVSSAVTIDASNAAGGVAIRYGTGGFTKQQPAHTVESTTITLTIAELLTQIIVGTPAGASVNYVLPSATLIVGEFDSPAVNDSFDFHVINIDGSVGNTIEIATSAGATLVGNMHVTGAGATTDQSQGHFRIRITNVGAPAFTCYRIG